MFEECDACQELITETANENVSNNVDFYEDCESHSEEWSSMINQSPKGRFAKYDQVY